MSSSSKAAVSSRKRKATIISDVVIVPKKCSERKKRKNTIREPEQPEESLIDLLASITPSDFTGSSFLLPETVSDYSLGDSLRMPSSSSSSPKPAQEGAMQPPRHTEMKEAATDDDDSTQKVIIINDDDDDNVQFAQNAQPWPQIEEDEDFFQPSETMLKKLDLFKNGVAEGFNIPYIWIPTDNTRCLLAMKFWPLDVARTIFALVELDPTKNFSVVFRVTYKNRLIQFECLVEFLRCVKRVVNSNSSSAKTEGVTISMKNGELC